MPRADPAADRAVLDTSARPAVLRLTGCWRLHDGIPDARAMVARLDDTGALAVDASGIERWDSSLAAFVRSLEAALADRGIRLESATLPDGVERLLGLVRASTAPPHGPPQRRGLLVRLGSFAAHAVQRGLAWQALTGRAAVSLWRLVTGRARVPWRDLLEQLVECGPRALPIVTLLSFLIGGITAFVGVVQLRQFAAEIYVADLVAMGMLLEMGALMTGVIMAGRAGAAFAAALGTMQSNEEIDALQTLGLDPVEFLVLPRMLALTLMMPLLTLYANLMGIAGGAAVGLGMLDMTLATYLRQTTEAMSFDYAMRGLIKSLAFGLVIGFAGCLRGIECGRSAMAVGRATTSAVVTAVVLMVVADAFVTVLYFVYDGLL